VGSVTIISLSLLLCVRCRKGRASCGGQHHGLSMHTLAGAGSLRVCHRDTRCVVGTVRPDACYGTSTLCVAYCLCVHVHVCVQVPEGRGWLRALTGAGSCRRSCAACHRSEVLIAYTPSLASACLSTALPVSVSTCCCPHSLPPAYVAHCLGELLCPPPSLPLPWLPDCLFHLY
jgi:hypothetical protein